MTTQRQLEPEILDDLDPADPRAITSRRDLRRINFLMGNERWILRQVARRPAAARGITEWGAGDGHLLARLAAHGPAAGIDRVARPADLPPDLGWHAADLLDTDPATAAQPGGLVVANLLLHHFDEAQLRRLGAHLRASGSTLICVEPRRSPAALACGKAMLPWVSEVTRHDMIVSIRAGFRAGELAPKLGLTDDWHPRESPSWRGGLRTVLEREA